MPEETIQVELAKLVLEPAFQVRAKVSPSWVSQIKKVYLSGREVPPIRIAEVDGLAYLVDGFHRVEAMRQLGEVNAWALITRKASFSDARWLAASANLSHGMPLKTAERVQVFKAFIAARRHLRNPDFRGALLSYRDIAKHVAADPTTVRRWMRKYHPKIASAMAGESTEYAGQFESRTIPSVSEREVVAALDKAVDSFKRVRNPETRHKLAQAARKMLAVMLEAEKFEIPGDF